MSKNSKVKLILTQIMKNESHVAERMLNSIKDIVDGICVIDTGSTDNSIEVVREWGEKNNIETYVFERPFDGFENSRNFSLEKAREVFLGKNDGNTYYNFWLDFDEQLIIDDKFNKNKIDKDMYMFQTKIGKMNYTRNEMCRLDKPFKFYGPIHEYLVSESKDITTGIMEGLTVNVSMDGASWKGDIAQKYKDHAFVIEKYIDEDRSDPRWIFYTAQSYYDSAKTDSQEENEERLRRAIKYYKERVSRVDGYYEERYYAQYRLANSMMRLQMPWRDTLLECLKAHDIEPLRGESIKMIIDYYMEMNQWNMAYLYSKFAVNTFHGKNPYPHRLLFIDEVLYNWKFLDVHCVVSFYTRRFDEAKEYYKMLLALTKSNPNIFPPEDIARIESNKNFFMQ